MPSKGTKMGLLF